MKNKVADEPRLNTRKLFRPVCVRVYDPKCPCGMGGGVRVVGEVEGSGGFISSGGFG